VGVSGDDTSSPQRNIVVWAQIALSKECHRANQIDIYHTGVGGERCRVSLATAPTGAAHLGETCTSVSASSTNCKLPGNADINDSLSRADALTSVALFRRAGRRPLRWQLGRPQPLTLVPRRLCASPITGRDGDVAHSLWSVKTLTWSTSEDLSGLSKSQLHKAFATANHGNLPVHLIRPPRLCSAGSQQSGTHYW
jgi:hypothetical protein